MKKTILNSLTICTLFFATALNAQVGVGVPAENIHPSAELEVKSNTKGFLLPRMTKVERDAIVAPAAGLLIYQTDAVANNPAGLYFFDGTDWKNGAGVQGIKGDKGDKGDKGETGTTGAVGSTGSSDNGGGFSIRNTSLIGTQGGITIAGQGINVTGTGTDNDPYIVSSKIYTIGFWPELGGYVFRISADGRHGLVAETKDQSTSSTWYDAQDVISNPVNHSTNGQKFMDWRLPTKYELIEMYVQKGAIGGFSMADYWSSLEDEMDLAWAFDFGRGEVSGNGHLGYFKFDPYFVRAVRAF